jgi:hypothetical protein
MEEDVIANEVQREWYTKSLKPKAARQQGSSIGILPLCRPEGSHQRNAHPTTKQ